MTGRPTGAAPETIEFDGDTLQLREIALKICVRYRAEFDVELPTADGLADDWCVHDNQWLLSWAFADVLGLVDFEEQAKWLASVLHHRDFPAERYLRNLAIAAEVVGEQMPGDPAVAVVSCIERAAQKIADHRFDDSVIPASQPPT